MTSKEPQYFVYKGDITKPLYVGCRDTLEAAEDFALRQSQEFQQTHWVAVILSVFKAAPVHAHPAPTLTI